MGVAQGPGGMGLHCVTPATEHFGLTSWANTLDDDEDVVAHIQQQPVPELNIELWLVC